ncbi:uncharacterized protein Dyak_GE11262 [Drosophila yakuba]|uniref:Uncharacterized protein n=1 Tax=Drosophila yakuba TaxID=7245 RepID=B4ISV7_DROYA|nr:uncharacterized protein Dyak_GE11262 [Drosophila yakuba]
MPLWVLQLNLHKSKVTSAELLIALEQGTDDLTVVMLESERNRLLVASCYMAHDRTAPPEKLRSMVEASPNEQQLIVGADANAHHCSQEEDQATLVEWLLSLLRNNLREFFQIAKHANNDVVNGEYKILLRDYNKEIRRAQSSSWRNFCSKIETAPETARLRKLLSKLPTVQSQLKREDGQWTEGSEEALTALMHGHFPGCTEISDASKHQDLLTGEEHLPTDLISSRRIQWAIDSFTGIKASGLDGIFPAMLQVTKEVFTPWLHAIFTACLSTCYIPIQWRTSRIVFLPKAGKCSHMSSKVYRTISLTSFTLKTLEKLLDVYIRNDAGRLLSSNHHAYTKGKSVETALHSLVATIEKVWSVCVYISGEFNNVTTDAIMDRLEVDNTPPAIRLWIRNSLSCRRVQSDWGTASMGKGGIVESGGR